MTDIETLVDMVYDVLKEQGFIEPVQENDIIVTRNNPPKVDIIMPFDRDLLSDEQLIELGMLSSSTKL